MFSACPSTLGRGIPRFLDESDGGEAWAVVKQGDRTLSRIFVTRHRGEHREESRAATHSSSNNNILLKFLFLGRCICVHTYIPLYKRPKYMVTRAYVRTVLTVMKTTTSRIIIAHRRNVISVDLMV